MSFTNLRVVFSLAAIALLTATLNGCSMEPVLIPDTGANSEKGLTTQSFVEQSGIRVWVDGAAWNGDPEYLSRVLTPVKVVIENGSEKPLRVAYKDFSLMGGTGFRYTAVAPLPGEAPVSMRAEPSMLQLAQHRTLHRPAPPPHRYPHRRFFLAPHYRYWGSHPFIWVHPFPYDPYAYGRFTWPKQLPSADMIAQALPEGVVEPDGHVEGFVYFQAVARRETRVTFEMNLVDAAMETSFGRIQVPLRVQVP